MSWGRPTDPSPDIGGRVGTWLGQVDYFAFTAQPPAVFR